MGDVRQSVYTREELRTYALAEAGYLGRIGVRAVVTGFTLTTLLSSRLAGIPLVTEHNGSWLPPLWEHGLLPVPADPPWPWMRHLPVALARRLVDAAPARVSWYCGPLNAVAAELGVEPVPSMTALTLGDVALLTEAPEVVGLPAAAFTSCGPRRAAVARAPRRRPATGRGPGSRSPTDLRQVADPAPGRGPSRAGRAGTSRLPGDDADPGGPDLRHATLGAVVGAARGLRVLVAGTVHEPERLLDGVSRDRVTVCGVLPSHLVMPRVDVAITTAGQGSLQSAMAAGTPVVGCPCNPSRTSTSSCCSGAAPGCGLRPAPPGHLR